MGQPPEGLVDQASSDMADPAAPAPPPATPVVPISGPPAPPLPAPAATGHAPERDYSQVKVGDDLKGITVRRIYAQTDAAIVFESDRGLLNLDGDIPEQVLAELGRLNTLAASKLRRAYERDLDCILGLAVAHALTLPDDADLDEVFAPAEAFIHVNAPVPYVYGRDTGYIVFADRNGDTVCDYPNVAPQHVATVSEFHRLLHVGKTSLAKEELATFHQVIGTELSTVLRAEPAPAEPRAAFPSTREFLRRRLEAHTRSGYVLSSLFAAAGLSIIPLTTFGGDVILTLGACGGIIGALVSVLHRAATTEVTEWVPKQYVALQAFVRMTLGAFFGVLVVAAMRAGIALPLSKENDASVFLLGVVAGFSERLIPDLLDRLASDASSKAARPDAKS